MKAKIRVVLVLLFVVLFSNLAKCQVFVIQSLNGEEEQLKILWSQENDILKLCSSRSCFYIKDVRQIEIVKKLSEEFFMIVYNSRGGSDIQLRKTLLLCINNGNIYQALHMTSLFREETLDFRKQPVNASTFDMKSVYTVGMLLLGNNKYGYKLSIQNHKERIVVQEPKRNYSYNIAAMLKFDKGRNVFYDSYEPVSQILTVFNPKTGNEAKCYIKGVFPMVALGEYRYYYVENHWYVRTNDNELIKWSYD